MKVIELLNKIYNGDPVPKKVESEFITYTWDGVRYIDSDGNELLSWANFFSKEILDYEVKILEDKPKKIGHIGRGQNRNDKINEVIDAVNYLLEKSNNE